MSRYGYLDSPLDFEIIRVDCNLLSTMTGSVTGPAVNKETIGKLLEAVLRNHHD